jgi:hypothetical protein
LHAVEESQKVSSDMLRFYIAISTVTTGLTSLAEEQIIYKNAEIEHSSNNIINHWGMAHQAYQDPCKHSLSSAGLINV